MMSKHTKSRVTGSAGRLDNKSEVGRELLERILSGLRDRGSVISIKINCTGTSRDEEHLVSDKLRVCIVCVVTDMLSTI